MIFNQALATLVLIAATPATAHVRSRELTRCGEIDKCYLFNRDTKKKMVLEEEKYYDYEVNDKGYALICETTEDTIDGTAAVQSDYQSGSWIVYMKAWPRAAPLDGRDDKDALSKSFGTNDRGEWKFQQHILEKCEDKTMIGVGGYVNGKNRCDARLYKFKCNPPPPPPTPAPATPAPTPGTPAPTPGTPAPTPGKDNCPFPAGGDLEQGFCKFGEFAIYEIKKIADGKCEAKCEKASKIAELAQKYPGKYSCDCDLDPPKCPDGSELQPGCDGKFSEYAVFETKKVQKNECDIKCVKYADLFKGFAEGKYQCDCTPPPPGSDPCGVCDKPLFLQFKLLDFNCIQAGCNSMDKSSVSGDVTNGPISISGGFNAVPDSAAIGEVFTISTTEKWGSNLPITLTDATGQQQNINFHTSCSSPIIRNDQYGRLQLVGYNDQTSGNGCGFTEDSPEFSL